MFYKSSKGPVEIETMPLRCATNALNKLSREEPGRREEIEALENHVAALAERGEEPVATIGDNNPPEDITPAPSAASWAAIKLHMDDLLDQVRGITGVEITEQAMADQAGQLLRDLQQVAADAEKVRVAEKAPYDAAIKEIQDRFNAYIAPIKNKVPGTVSKAELALKNQIGAWLRKLDDEKREREAAAREVAAKAEAEARAAHMEAVKSNDLDQIDAAEELLSAADDAARTLRAVEQQKAQVRSEGHRAIGLRSVWRAERIEGEGGKALSHYARTQPARVIEFIQALADEEVRRGAREIPGFNIIEERVAA